MKIVMASEKLAALRAFLDLWDDAELLSEKGNKLEYVVDFYELDRPASMDLILAADALYADGAAWLAYDETLDGWYISEPIDQADVVTDILQSVGAFGA